MLWGRTKRLDVVGILAQSRGEVRDEVEKSTIGQDMVEMGCLAREQFEIRVVIG